MLAESLVAAAAASAGQSNLATHSAKIDPCRQLVGLVNCTR